MSNAPRITYAPRPGATREGEVAALGDIYDFVLRSGEARRAGENQEGGPDTAPDDGTKIKGDSADAILHD